MKLREKWKLVERIFSPGQGQEPFDLKRCQCLKAVSYLEVLGTEEFEFRESKDFKTQGGSLGVKDAAPTGGRPWPVFFPWVAVLPGVIYVSAAQLSPV